MPATGARVELNLAGAWTDITSDVYTRDGIQITRGRQDQGARVDPGSCSFTLNNKDGRFSPRNPLSPLYGLIGRNTPVRVSVPAASPYLLLPGTSGARVSTPDTAALDITGDIDVRVDMVLNRWGTGPAQTYVDVLGKSAGNGSFSWRLQITPDGCLMFTWSPTGLITGQVVAAATTPVPLPPGRRVAVRAALDVNTGAGGWACTFYYSTAPGTSGPWTTLQIVTGTGTTSIFNSVSPVDLGDISGTVSPVPPVGRVYAVEIRNGINGTVVANPSFATQTPGAGSFTDGAGRTWTLAGGVEISDREPRFVGEISAWPARWDVSGGDVRVPVQAAGILRRLGQGASPLDSTLRRRVTSWPTTVAYWPMEDGQGATQAYSPLPGVQPARIGGAQMASDDSLAGSLALPSWPSASSFVGTVPPYTSTSWQVQFVYAVASVSASYKTMVTITSTGTVRTWTVEYETGAVRVRGADGDGTLVVDQEVGVGADIIGDWTRQQFEVTQSGTTVTWHIGWTVVGADGGSFTGSFTGSAGRVTSVRQTYASWDSLRLGHVAVFSDSAAVAFDHADTGFDGDTAADRYSRLCGEEGIPATTPYPVLGAAVMGPQRPNEVLDLLEEAADADVGVLYEARDSIALAYRPRWSLYNQAAALSLDYTARGEVAPDLTPTEDDTETRNDITIGRPNGSSARVTLDSGPLSVQAPPAGVGRYTTSETLNVQSDGQLIGLASWLLHLGTWDEARYPQVTVNLAAGPWLRGDAATVDVGDLITITNPPPWLPPGDIRLMCQGYTETLGVHTWEITYNCTPAGPWDVAVVGDTVLGRADTGGAELASGITATTTTLSVATTGTRLWTTDPAEFPFDLLVGGEIVTATACTGSSSPQSMTVTRGTNGITRAWDAGTDVRLAHPMIAAL